MIKIPECYGKSCPYVNMVSEPDGLRKGYCIFTNELCKNPVLISWQMGSLLNGRIFYPGETRGEYNLPDQPILGKDKELICPPLKKTESELKNLLEQMLEETDFEED